MSPVQPAQWSLSRAPQDFPHQEAALQSETPSPLSLSFLALFILRLLCHQNKTFLVTAALSKAQFLQDHYSSSHLVLKLPVDLPVRTPALRAHLEVDRKLKGGSAFQAPCWHPEILVLFIAAPGFICDPQSLSVCSRGSSSAVTPEQGSILSQQPMAGVAVGTKLLVGRWQSTALPSRRAAPGLQRWECSGSSRWLKIS